MTDAANSAEQRPTSPARFVLVSTSLSLCDLDEDSRQCPICLEPYIEPQNTSPDGEHGQHGQEWAMRVEKSATGHGVITCCRHVFGSRCLDEHINSSEAWSNKCPLCRQVWGPPHELAPHRPPPPPPPREDIRRDHTDSVTQRSEGSSAGQNNPSRDRLPSQFRDTFAPQEGGEHVELIDVTISEIEAALSRIYQGRQQQQGGSDPASNGEASSDA